MNFVYVSAGVIFNSSSQVLIAKRLDNGLWEFPGGKLNEGEGYTHAVVRELKEELNIDVENVKRIVILHNLNGLTTYTVQFNACNCIDERIIKLSAHSEYRWVDVEDLHLVEQMCPIDYCAIPEVIKYHVKRGYTYVKQTD